jgi:hypothetical protein
VIKVDPEALAQMRLRGGEWAAYRNEALDSRNCGHMQFLNVGPGCSYFSPPEQYPADTTAGMGWRYRFVDMVNLKTGEVGGIKVVADASLPPGTAELRGAGGSVARIINIGGDDGTQEKEDD